MIPPAKAVPTQHGVVKKAYMAGTLRYSLRGLYVLFFWLLWGDFAFTFFESIFGRFIPLYLKDYHASNSLIGIMTGSIAGFVNIFFLPNISLWSDNYRSRFGRRIPFLYVFTPLTVASLVAVGFAPEIAAGFHRAILSHLAPAVSLSVVILSLLCAFAISFHLFNMVLANVYGWLLRDVVPQELMARFLSWFRIIGTVSNGAFLWFVFPYVITHRKEVCLGVGTFYLIIFLLMCYNIKEGEYPTPLLAKDRPGILKSFVIYFRECLSIPIYRNFIIASTLAFIGGTCASPFALLFNREILGICMDDLGKIFTYNAIASAVILVPIGWFCDKFSSMRIVLASLIGLSLGYIYICFFVDDKMSYLIFSLIFSIPNTGLQLGSQAMSMQLFPEEKFGQFSSALNIFEYGSLIFGNYLVGHFMDMAHSNYRMIFIWSATLTLLSFFAMLVVFRNWKQHGGPNHYNAPLLP